MDETNISDHMQELDPMSIECEPYCTTINYCINTIPYSQFYHIFVASQNENKIKRIPISNGEPMS